MNECNYTTAIIKHEDTCGSGILYWETVGTRGIVSNGRHIPDTF